MAKIGLSETHIPLKQNGRPSFNGLCVPVPVSPSCPGWWYIQSTFPGQPIQPRLPTPRLLNGNEVLHDGEERLETSSQVGHPTCLSRIVKEQRLVTIIHNAESVLDI